MKEYHIIDKDGKKRVIEKDNEITIEILEEPSAEYLSKMTSPPPEPEGQAIDLAELARKLDELTRRNP